MRMRKLGALEVSELGFGILSFASTYGQAPEKAESIRVIRGALELGVTLFDTAEVYGPWTNEALLGEALAPFRNEVVIATKFGFDIDPTTGERRGLNSQPGHIKRVTDAMLRRLGTNHIDLLYQHRVDGRQRRRHDGCARLVRHLPRHRRILPDDSQQAAVQDDDLFTQHPPDDEQRLNQYRQVGDTLNKLLDAGLEPHLANH